MKLHLVFFALAIGAGCSSHPVTDLNVAGPSALMDGFAVPRFSLTRGIDAQSEPNIEWSAPDGTTLVRCAYFWCAPQFEAVEGASDSPGGSLRRIKNYGECALSHVDSRGPSGVLTLSSFDPAKLKEPIVELQGRIPERIVGAGTSPAFSVGCWSFSDADVNGASVLVPVFPSEISALVSRGVSPDCSKKKAGGEDFLCEVRVKGAPPAAMGWCISNGECSPLCETCGDCQSLTSVTGTAYSDCRASSEAHVMLCDPGTTSACEP